MVTVGESSVSSLKPSVPLRKAILHQGRFLVNCPRTVMDLLPLPSFFFFFLETGGLTITVAVLELTL